MSLTRRNALALGSASFVVTLLPLNAFAASDETMAAIKSLQVEVQYLKVE